MIAIGNSPNTQLDDKLTALSKLATPLTWQDNRCLNQAGDYFKEKFDTDDVFFTDSGRSALYLILQALGIQKNEEIILQPFTCAAVVNPLLWLGAKPVYVDIDAKTLNIDPAKLAVKINRKTRAAVVQHTFGRRAPVDRINKITADKGIFLIEDCAHMMTDDDLIRRLKFIKAAFFSFGRDKAVSSVYGGLIITKDKELGKKLRVLTEKLPAMPLRRMMLGLFHPVIYLAVEPFYDFFNLGRMIIYLCLKIGLIEKPVLESELKGLKPANTPSAYHPALACLLRKQLEKLVKYNRRRLNIARLYRENLKDLPLELPDPDDFTSVLRYPVSARKAAEIYGYCRQRGIILGRWYANIIDPPGADLEKMGYIKGSCPVAEKSAEKILNLPVNPVLSDRQARQVILAIRKFYEHYL